MYRKRLFSIHVVDDMYRKCDFLYMSGKIMGRIVAFFSHDTHFPAGRVVS